LDVASRELKRATKKIVKGLGVRVGDALGFNTKQLAAIRYRDWKLITGKIDFDGLIPNPKTHLHACKLTLQ